jgi:hypothetical protein
MSENDLSPDEFRHMLVRFVLLSLEMERNSRGQLFEVAMRTFPTDKFHEWCDLAKRLERRRMPGLATEAPAGERKGSGEGLPPAGAG